MARERRRSGSAEFRLYPANTTLGWRATKRISQTVGDALVEAGHAELVFDEMENRHHYQLKAEKPVVNGLVSQEKFGSLTAHDARLIAGLHGRSRTAHLTEERRLTRCDQFGKPLPAEDAIERAQAKMLAYLTPELRKTNQAVMVIPHQ